MALDLTQQYPQQVDGSTPAYPLGKARNVTSPDDNFATPLDEAWLNDHFGFQQALLSEAGIVPSGEPDQVGASQYVDAIKELMQSREISGEQVTASLPYAWAPGINQSEKNRAVTTFLDAGAVGDGVTDDTVAIVAALSETGITEIDGLGRQYKVSGAQVFERGGITIKNAHFLVTGLTTGKFGFEFRGAQSASETLTADATDATLTMASTALFKKGDFIYVQSNKEWSSTPYPTVTCGEIAQVKATTSTTVTVRGRLACYYNTADVARVSRLDFLKGIKTKNVKTTNLDTAEVAEGGFKFTRCLGTLVDIESRNFQYAHVSLDRCAYTAVLESDLSGCKTLVGTNYGVVITDGCYVTTIRSCKGGDLRHFSSVGNTNAGGVSRFVSVQDCHVVDMHDAFFDSHVGCAEFSVTGCTGSTSYAGVGQDGIMAQNAVFFAANNRFDGVGRHGVAFSPMVNAGVSRAPLSVTTRNNTVVSMPNPPTGASRDAVLVLTSDLVGRAPVALVDLDGDKSSGFDYHYFISARTAAIDCVAMGNPITITPAAVRAIEVRAFDSVMKEASLRGGQLATSGATAPVYFRGYSSTSKILKWSIGGTGITGNGSTVAAVESAYTDSGSDNGVHVTGCLKYFNVPAATNAEFSSQTNIKGFADWAGGTIASGASASFNVNIADADYGDFSRGALTVAAQGADVLTRVDTAGQVRATVYNNAGGSRTFGALQVKVALNKNI